MPSIQVLCSISSIRYLSSSERLICRVREVSMIWPLRSKVLFLVTISMMTSPGMRSPVLARTQVALMSASRSISASAGPEVSTVKVVMSPISRAQATGCSG